MVPSTFVALEALPLTPNGKVDRKALPAPPKDGHTDHFVAPRNGLEQQLAQIWADLLNLEQVGVKDNFFELGGHSLLAVRLLVQLQQQFQQDISLTTLFKCGTIEELAYHLRFGTAGTESDVLIPLQPKGTQRPFFCVPGVGATAFYFYSLACHLGTDRPVYALQPQGLDGQQPPHTEIEAMASDYLQAIQAVQPQGPYLLGGHSFGGKVAFEMAQQLRRQGQTVGLVVILDTTSPSSQPWQPLEEEDDATHLTNLAFMFERLSGKSLDISSETLRTLNPEEQLQYFLEQFKTQDLFSPDTPLAQIQGLLNVNKVHSQITYQPQQPEPVPIAVFRAVEQQICPDPLMGWSSFANQIAAYEIPGDHITMLTPPYVQTLAQQLKSCLDQVDE